MGDNKNFSDQDFWKKLKGIGINSGINLIYYALQLYYTFQRPETPAWAKSIILGSIGYLISPIDGIPDLTPFIGYTDDLGVLIVGLSTVSVYINDDVKKRAKEKLEIWFPEFTEDELK